MKKIFDIKAIETTNGLYINKDDVLEYLDRYSKINPTLTLIMLIKALRDGITT